MKSIIVLCVIACCSIKFDTKEDLFIISTPEVINDTHDTIYFIGFKTIEKVEIVQIGGQVRQQIGGKMFDYYYRPTTEKRLKFVPRQIRLHDRYYSINGSNAERYIREFTILNQPND